MEVEAFIDRNEWKNDDTYQTLCWILVKKVMDIVLVHGHNK